MLDLATAYHDVLDAEIARAEPASTPALVRAGHEFFLESLSAFEMVGRGYREAREAALVERRHAAILRQLSNFLADASFALDAAGSLEEMLQLVVEQAGELIGARGCVARLGGGMTARGAAEVGEAAPGATIAAPLTAWDGRELGVIELSDKEEGDFTDTDVAVLVHLAQMASAAVERAQLYARDRETAAGLARGRAPAALPEVPGLVLASRYRPARPPSAGGGWHDVVVLDDGSAAVGIGDAGGGAAAAVQARAAFRTAAAAGDAPDATVARIGAVLADLGSGAAAAMLCAVIDPVAGSVRVAGGGAAAVVYAPGGQRSALDPPADTRVGRGAALVLTAGAASPPAAAAAADPDALWQELVEALPPGFGGDATLLVVRFE